MISPIQWKRVLMMAMALFASLCLLCFCSVTLIRADNPPPGCRIDPNGSLTCQGTAVATAVPTRVITVPPGTPRPTQPPLPTRTPTPWGLYTLWKYCAVEPSSPTGFVNLRYSCNQITKQCTLVQVVNASNCGTPTPTTIKVNPLPCPAGFTQTGVWCLIGWTRRAEARIPPVPITYKPYPRGIVTDKMEFTAPGLIVQDWACTSPQVDNWNPRTWGYDEDYRNLYFCIRWRQIAWPSPSPDPAPAWIRYVWDERAWGQPQEDASRQQVTEHIYVTSSAQKPENGAGNLPAYQVQAHSYWVIDWRMTWEHAFRWSDCRRTNNSTDWCDGQKGYETVSHVEWRGESDDGTADLRNYGAPHFYADSTLIRIPDGRVMNVLPVPVIEVQGVIGNP
ncbi:hypothetical protein GPROT1_02987 [Gammaproteobacteria bacterium]|nr:hypothetical protein GPROT1_02987 [Gammaproteobacteria bacterium]